MDEKIVERIKQIRKETGLSQDKFAKKIGVSSGNVSAWESGKALPGALALKSIHENLGCSIDWLLTGHSSQNGLGEIALDQDFKEMTDVLKRLLENENPDMRGWTKVQFKKTFGAHY
jgi:transcriptional regulator with XRE-family HTH domain